MTTDRPKLPKYVSLNDKSQGKNKPNGCIYYGKFIHAGVIYRCGGHKTIKEAQIAVDIKRLSLALKPT